MAVKFIFLHDSYRERKLLNKIYIENFPNNLTFIGLELSGQTYFKVEKENIEQIYNEHINLIEYWGFSQPIPIYGTLIIKFDGNYLNEENILDIEYIDDDFRIWDKVFKNIENFYFYDERIQQNNYLSCKGCLYDIAYNL